MSLWVVESSGSSQGTLHVLNVLETVAQVADERVVHVLEHSSFSDDIADAFGADDCMRCQYPRPRHNCGLVGASSGSRWAQFAPSSFRMYFSANDSPVSFRSTMRTFPKAPRPTTRNRRKWFRLTVCGPPRSVIDIPKSNRDHGRSRLTLAVEVDGLALAVTHWW